MNPLGGVSLEAAQSAALVWHCAWWPFKCISPRRVLFGPCLPLVPLIWLTTRMAAQLVHTVLLVLTWGRQRKSAIIGNVRSKGERGREARVDLPGQGTARYLGNRVQLRVLCRNSYIEPVVQLWLLYLHMYDTIVQHNAVSWYHVVVCSIRLFKVTRITWSCSTIVDGCIDINKMAHWVLRRSTQFHHWIPLLNLSSP